MRWRVSAAWLILLWLSSAAWAQPTPGNTLVSPLVTGLVNMGTAASEKIRLFDGGSGATSYGFGISGGDLQSFLGGTANQFSWRGAGYNSSTVMILSGLGALSVGASLQIGTASLTTVSGEQGFAKIAASGSAPGPAGAKFEWVCGTNAGSMKLISYAGTSTTPVTIIDNVGSGGSGC